MALELNKLVVLGSFMFSKAISQDSSVPVPLHNASQENPARDRCDEAEPSWHLHGVGVIFPTRKTRIREGEELAPRTQSLEEREPAPPHPALLCSTASTFSQTPKIHGEKETKTSPKSTHCSTKCQEELKLIGGSPCANITQGTCQAPSHSVFPITPGRKGTNTTPIHRWGKSALRANVFSAQSWQWQTQVRNPAAADFTLHAQC